jgi:hypothetical protein
MKLEEIGQKSFELDKRNKELNLFFTSMQVNVSITESAFH